MGNLGKLEGPAEPRKDFLPARIRLGDLIEFPKGVLVVGWKMVLNFIVFEFYSVSCIFLISMFLIL